MSGAYVGYMSGISVSHGEALSAHVASRGEDKDCWVDLYHVTGCLEGVFAPELDFLARCGPVAPLRHGADTTSARLGPGDADTLGCRWPACAILDAVPDGWPSGLMLAQFTNADRPTGRGSRLLGQDALVVLRPRLNAVASPVLVQLGVATWNAYHIWQSRNLYIGDVGDRTGAGAAHLRAHRVSFERPGVGLAPRSNIEVFPPTAYMYALPFIQWAREEELQIDYCAGTDIHRGLVELDDYSLLVTLGHDEYWTRRQRDEVEAFIAKGGNAAFFGGNLAYWQIRLAEDGSAVECYKRAPDPHELLGSRGTPLDPCYRDPHAYPEHDNSEVTVEYHTPPLNRPPNAMTGVSMRNDDGAHIDDPQAPRVYCGAAWWWENFGGPERPQEGFTVIGDDHWAFAGTDLKNGHTFGAEQKLIGFECDGLDVEFVDQTPVPTLRDGAPTGIEILAYADCRDWAELDHSVNPPRRTPGRRLNDAALGGVVTMVTFRSAAGGCVFTAPVTDWPMKLIDLIDYTDYRATTPSRLPACPAVRVITANVLHRLGCTAQMGERSE